MIARALPASVVSYLIPGMLVSRANTLPDGGYLPYQDVPKPEELEAIYGLETPKGEKDPAQVELFHVDEATGELEEPEGETSEADAEGEPSAPAADAAAGPEGAPAEVEAGAPVPPAEESPREEEP